MSIVMETDPNTGMRSLETHVLLLAPSFGAWKGQYQLPKEQTTVQVNGVAVQQASTSTPRSNLMTDDCPTDILGMSWKKRFNTMDSRLKKKISAFSVPFPIKGVRIVPRRKGDQFLADVSDTRHDMNAAAQEFVDDLPGILEQIRRNTDPTVWRAIEEKIPRDRHKMRDKFHVDVVPVRIDTGGGFDPTIVDADMLQEESEITRDTIRRKVTEAIESMVSGPREQLAQTLANLRELVNRDGRVNAGSFAPVKAAIAKLRAFDFVADSALLHTMDQLDRRLNITSPTSLDRQTAAASGFTAALETVEAEVTSAQRSSDDVARFGRELRGLDL